MSRIQKKRLAQQIQPPSNKKELEQTLRRQMAAAAGTEFFQHRDPLYHVTESFRQTFDAIGAKHAGEAAERERFPERRQEAVQQSGEAERETEELPDSASARSFYQRGSGRDQDTIRRFSETAFQRGTMSAAVLRGTGKMMLFSCLKKTIGQSHPVKEQQRKLFETASQIRNVPGRAPDKVVFNRTFVDSAVGLVVDTLRDARRTVEDMQDLARGGLNRTESGDNGADTLRTMYPFLDDSREREMLSQYYAWLDDSEGLGADEKGLLQNAIDRTRGLIDKKAGMKAEFINKLRFLADRATEALAEFEQPDFTETLGGALREIYGAEEPPDDGEGEGDDGAAEPEPADPGADAGAAATEAAEP